MTETVESAATTTANPRAHAGSRDAAVDLVRALALLRVIVFHASGNLVVLTFLPAMPVMFFLGGRYVALSLDRRPPAEVLSDRARRLLWPTAVYLMVVVMTLIAAGHQPRNVALSMGNSIVPLGDGSHDATADWFFSTLWYLRDYLVGVAISPILLLAVRSRPRLTAAATVVLLGATFALDLGSLTAMYLTFWLLGMHGARRQAFARRADVPTPVTVLAGTVFVAGGAVLLATAAFPWSQAAGDLAAGVGCIMLLGVAIGPVTRFAERPLPSRAATWLQQRAVTTYLWQMLPVIALFHIAGISGRALESAGQALWIIPAAVVGTLVVVAAVAPIEHRT